MRSHYFSLLFFLLFCSCDRDDATALRFIKADGGKSPKISVEVVAEDSQRHRGLMYRRELAADSGMLFVFPRFEEHKMWMKNTYVSLDMVFLDDELKVVGVLQQIPVLNEEVRTINKPSRYVLEIPAGTVAEDHISVGDRAITEQPLPNPS